ncbi:histidine--tRNA ligase [Candidatus Nephthysia bennettiae]
MTRATEPPTEQSGAGDQGASAAAPAGRPNRKLSTAPYRGTRDFLPEEMSVRTQVFSRLFRTIETFGYLRYDGPTLEPVALYEAKSSLEVVNDQMYRLTDRGGRELALRPEMTPTVARMIAANAERLRFPARWYSFIPCFRYERPQRGRVREHWQINVDVFGSESPQAEVELFELIHEMFASLAVESSAYSVRVSDRVLLEGAFSRYAEVGAEQMRGVFRILDRWSKVPRQVIEESLDSLGLRPEQVRRVCEIATMSLDGIREAAGPETAARSNLLKIFDEGLTEAPLVFDPLIVRAFEYYTSTVFEVYDTAPENSRSLFGGGRYDNLVALFSDRRIPGIGFALGDVTLFDFLQTHGALPEPDVNPHAVVLPVSPALRGTAKELARELRRAGLRTVLPPELSGLSKDLREAARQHAGFAVIVADDELARGNVIVRDLTRSEQVEVPLTQAAEHVDRALRARH